MEKALKITQNVYTQKSIYTPYERPMRLEQLEAKRQSRYALQVKLEEKKREKTEKAINALKGFGLGVGSVAVLFAACLMVV